jgi:sulfotransferase family protein
MMNWLAIPRLKLCFPEPGSFSATWLGVFSLVKKSDLRNTLNCAGENFYASCISWIVLPIARQACLVRALAAVRTVPLKIGQYPADQGIMRIGLPAPTGPSMQTIGKELMSLFPWRTPQVHQDRDPGPYLLNLMPIIVGAPRSGTTLLRLMLDSHPELAIPPETGFLNLAAELMGRDDKVRERFVRALMTYPTEAPCWPDFEISEEALRTALTAISPFSIANGYRAFYRLYAGRFGKSRWGDKTPLYCMNLATIRQVLPEARFVHIIRDGRATAISMKRMWFSPSDKIGDLASYWRSCVLEARSAGSGSHDYLEVRYEDLILNAEATLRRICNFIDLEYDEVMLQYYLRAPERLKEHKGRTLSDGTSLVTREQRIRQQQRTTEPPDPTQVFGWRSAMNAKERKEFESVAGDLLANLGYETEGNGVPLRHGKRDRTNRS